MVAYSFKPGFLPAIVALEKQQTIRLPRKRHARAGEALQLFTGPRMRPSRVGAAVCLAVREVRLDFDADVVIFDDAVEIRGEAALDAFAVRDGFSTAGRRVDLRPWEYMRRWWAVTHPGQPVFLGVLIDWGDSFAPFVPGELAA